MAAVEGTFVHLHKQAQHSPPNAREAKALNIMHSMMTVFAKRRSRAFSGEHGCKQSRPGAMTKLLAALVAMAIWITPTTAQQAFSVRDAAIANVAGLTRLCVDVMLRRAKNGAAFSGAGFAYRAEDRGVNQHGIHRGIGHYFDAPANTAKVEVDAVDRPAGICTVYTTHLNEGEVSALIASTLQQFYPFAVQRSANDWHLSQNGALPLLLGISTIGNRHRYERPGTVRVSMSYPG